MKKTLTMLAICAVGVSAFAQGEISINESAIKVSINNNVSTTTMSTVSGAYIFDILTWSGAGTPTVTQNSDLTSSSWLDTGAYGFNATSAPKAGQIGGPATTVVTVGGPWASGTAASAFYVIVGWNSGLAGNSWSTVEQDIAGSGIPGGNFFGFSTVGSGTSNESPASGAGIIGTSPGVTSGFVLGEIVSAPTPEPATLALFGLGSVGLLALRRKK